jgi:hypothetical protein
MVIHAAPCLQRNRCYRVAYRLSRIDYHVPSHPGGLKATTFMQLSTVSDAGR